MSSARNRKELNFISAKGIDAHFGWQIDQVVRAVYEYRDMHRNMQLSDLFLSDADAFYDYAKNNAYYIACKEAIVDQAIEELRGQIRHKVFGKRRNRGNYKRSLALIHTIDIGVKEKDFDSCLIVASIVSCLLMNNVIWAIFMCINVFGLWNSRKESAKQVEESERRLRRIISQLVDLAIEARVVECDRGEALNGKYAQRRKILRPPPGTGVPKEKIL